jgi:hypothetical protein
MSSWQNGSQNFLHVHENGPKLSAPKEFMSRMGTETFCTQVHGRMVSRNFLHEFMAEWSRNLLGVHGESLKLSAPSSCSRDGSQKLFAPKFMAEWSQKLSAP